MQFLIQIDLEVAKNSMTNQNIEITGAKITTTAEMIAIAAIILITAVITVEIAVILAIERTEITHMTAVKIIIGTEVILRIDMMITDKLVTIRMTVKVILDEDAIFMTIIITFATATVLMPAAKISSKDEIIHTTGNTIKKI